MLQMTNLITLNGTSSSGKTSITRKLQKPLLQVWLNFSIDSVLYALPQAELGSMISGETITRDEHHYPKLV